MKREELYKQMAEEYLERYGAELRQEMTALEDSSPEITPRLDRLVRRKLRSGDRRRVLQGIAFAAACLALAIIAPRLVGSQKNDMVEHAAPSAERREDALLYDAGEPETAAEEADDLAPAEAAPAAPEEAVAGGGAAAASGASEIIPLSFSLPPEYTVADEKVDQGQSIYYLANDGLDDVVLTMEYADGPVPEAADLTAIPINGAEVYGLSEADYNFLTFRKDGILYTLTCRHDINTLVSLGRAIL